MVFLCLFALPFAGFGLFAMATAIRQMADGTGKSPVWMLFLFGLVFSAVGFGLVFAAIFGSRYLKRQQRAQAEHPAEPWLWREDWAQGRIQSNTRSGMIGAWIFAALWNAVSMPVLIFLPQEAAKKPVAYIGFVFPIAGVFLLVRAIRFTLAYFEFGKTYFEMSPVPGVIGGELKGTIQARFPHSPDHGVQLHLSCVNRTTTGSSDSRSTSERILWRGEANLSAGQLYPAPTGAAIPVHFKIPWDTQSTDTTNPSNAIVWKLEALADVPGVDYHDVFEVPVFRTKQTPSQPGPEDLADASAPVMRPAAMTAVVTQTGQGVEFYFPPARNKGFAAGTTVFLAIFGAAAIFLAFHAPLIFPIVFGFFALLLFYFTVQMWFGTTRVGISNSELLVQDGYLGGGKVRRFALAELVSIGSKITSQQGDGTGTPYYDIELRLRSGRKVTLGRTLRSKQEVDWLIEEMRRLTGLQPKAAAAGQV
jgi:hypothetical protein